MSWTQAVAANYNTVDYAGYCLRFTQTVFGAPVNYPTAWDAWLNQTGKHETREMPNADVPIFFESWGDYGFGEYKNWGHAAVYQASTGRVFSSPGSGYGNKWFNSIAEAEAQWGMKYAGWTENLNGLQIVNYSGDPAPAPTPSAGTYYDVIPGDNLWGIAERFYGFANWDNVNNIAAVNGIENPALIFPGQHLLIPGV